MGFGQTATILTISLFAIIIRWTISLNSYSGHGKPPMFGDFEAQRHWMEITYNLPSSEWYKNTSNNDLLYWGLDYPPLTAYHSWICAAVSDRINSSWVSLFTSRGFESAQHKIFMRYTVLVVDLLIFFPAVFVFFHKCYKDISSKDKIAMCALTLVYPGLMLIDHGHFQYNCVSLGLYLWAIIGFLTKHDLLGSIAFVLALNYKQMELYHALPVFCYLLGTCFKGKELWLWKLIKLGVVVSGSFAICWLPFLDDPKKVLQVAHRLFPFSRGLYEDKVANVWCSLSVLIKFKQLLDVNSLIKLCLATTGVLLLPSSLHLLIKPTTDNLKFALINSSLIFFLFSFQVHEKSILLAAMSAVCVLPQSAFAAVWFMIISTFSMLPLLIKDGLLLPYIASTMLFYTGACLGLSNDITSETTDHKAIKSDKTRPIVFWPSLPVILLFILSMLGAVALSAISVIMTPPPDLPDIFPVLISVYSCGHFLLFLVYFHYKQFCSKASIMLSQSESQRAAKSLKDKKSHKKKYN